MAIGFNEIPLSINTPGSFVEFDTSRAVQGVPLQPHETLIIGLQAATGTATAGAIQLVKSATDAITKHGQHSPIAQAVAAYKSIDSLTPVYTCGLAESTGTQATGTFAFSGPATADGEWVGYVGGRRVSVAITSGDTATEIGDALVTAYNLLTDTPCTVANSLGTVTATARLDGPHGNFIALGQNLQDGEESPAGVSCVVTQMASGATSEDYATAVTAMGDDQYHTIVMTSSDATEVGKLITELERRWGPMIQIEGSVFVSQPDSQADLTSYGNALNSQVCVVVGYEDTALSPLPWEVAALVAARDARQAQTDPARALTGISLGASTKHAPRGSRFTRAQRDTILTDGVSTVKAASDGRMVIERLVTTYQTNSAGIADPSLSDQPTVRTLAALRFSLRARIALKFPRHKLADDGNEVVGQPIVTPSIIRGEILTLFREWQSLGWVENYDQFAEELLVERDGSDPNRVNAILPPDLINNFLVFAGQVSFIR